MAQVCLYFQLHQPYRLQSYSLFDVSTSRDYFADGENEENQQIFRKVAMKSYIPMLTLLRELLAQHSEFQCTLSCSGVFLEQARAFEPAVIALLQDLVATGRVELLAETYYHSLASLYDESEFAAQVAAHALLLEELFAYRPKVFRNTELIYSDDIARQVARLGYRGMLTEAVDRYLDGRPRTQVFRSASEPALPLLLKHAQLSDDIAFRFSDKNWAGYPLTAEVYSHWLAQYYPDEYINLFMDFETFGEHQWADTGIFEFMRHVVAMCSASGHHFVTPSQVSDRCSELDALEQLPVYHVPDPISWADVDRDLTAWRGNSLQDDALRVIYELAERVVATNDARLLHAWRKLQTSDHFYYMCVKWSADGDVHKYFSPYDSPFEAYNRYSAVLVDFIDQVAQTTTMQTSAEER